MRIKPIESLDGYGRTLVLQLPIIFHVNAKLANDAAIACGNAALPSAFVFSFVQMQAVKEADR